MFISLQNGNLVNKFKPKLGDKNNEDLNIQEYIKNNINELDDMDNHNHPIQSAKHSIFKNIDVNNKKQMIYLKQVILAYKNFISFIEDDVVEITHEYLWDFFTMGHPLLFKKGVNMCIFEITNNDITNNIEFICPLNSFSKYKFNPYIETIFIIKRDNFYEPLYLYNSSKQNVFVQKMFTIQNKYLPKIIRDILNRIVIPIHNQGMCTKNKINNSEIQFNQPLGKDIILNNIKKQFTLLKQVINYDNKTIGIIIQHKTDLSKSGFIPCKPSFIDSSIPYVFMTDINIWTTYKKTISFLKEIDELSNKIGAKPMFKIVEDGYIVGVLTKTDQFILINPPESTFDINDDIKEMTENNYVVKSDISDEYNDNIDPYIITSHGVDNDRKSYIERLKNESKIYGVFRNIIRMFINDFDNIHYKDAIENILFMESNNYDYKMNKILEIIKKMNNNRILFNDDYDPKPLGLINDCINSGGVCDYTDNICSVVNNNQCNIVLPKRNLITNKENEIIYYEKITDELIRNKRISFLLLNSTKFISFTDVSFIINDNEIILLKSLLKQYFINPLKSISKNKYIHYTTPDDTKRLKEHTLNMDTDFKNKNKQPYNVSYCSIIIPHPFKGNGVWKKKLKSGINSFVYDFHSYCTFQPIIDLYTNQYEKGISVKTIKLDLMQEYDNYKKLYYKKIIIINTKYGNEKLYNNIIYEHNASLFESILSYNYTLTILDIWVLCNKYKLPTILLSESPIEFSSIKRNYFKLYGCVSDKYAFIHIRSSISNKYPYQIITHDKSDDSTSINSNSYNYFLTQDIY
jgi:hypothetical protein